jgi:pimeloyl-ACP methyl ester carboxylesterase
MHWCGDAGQGAVETRRQHWTKSQSPLLTMYHVWQLEARLAASPNITVPTITLEGDANGAPHPEPGAYAKKFSGKYEHRTIDGGVGHNPPQEAPQAFAQAILDVAVS